MWWVRRYVPEVLPLIIILMAVALAAALIWRFRGRRVLALPALAGAAALLGIYLHQSLHLRHHNEYAASFQVPPQLASVAGPADGVFLFGTTGCCITPEYIFGGALWLERGQDDALMPATSGDKYVREVAAAMPGHPVFVIWNGTAEPPLGSVGLVAAKHITAALPMWEESDAFRPNKDGPSVPVDFTIWRVVGT